MKIEEIINYAKEKKITQVELAKRSGLPLVTINDIFRGKIKNPRIDTVNALAEALGVEFDILKEGEYKIGHFRTGIKDRIIIYDHSGDTYEFNFPGEDFEHILKVCEALTADYNKLDYIKRK